jgi:hypothetical protein
MTTAYQGIEPGYRSVPDMTCPDRHRMGHAPIHGVCDDYRAGATIDDEMDSQDFEARRRVACPVLVLVGGQSHTARFYGDAELRAFLR